MSLDESQTGSKREGGQLLQSLLVDRRPSDGHLESIPGSEKVDGSGRHRTFETAGKDRRWKPRTRGHTRERMISTNLRPPTSPA